MLSSTLYVLEMWLAPCLGFENDIEIECSPKEKALPKSR